MKLTLKPIEPPSERPVQIVVVQNGDYIEINATNGEVTANLYRINNLGIGYIVHNNGGELRALGFQTQCDGREIKTV